MDIRDISDITVTYDEWLVMYVTQESLSSRDESRRAPLEPVLTRGQRWHQHNGLWLVLSDHVTWILVSDWSWVITWHQHNGVTPHCRLQPVSSAPPPSQGPVRGKTLNVLWLWSKWWNLIDILDITWLSLDRELILSSNRRGRQSLMFCELNSDLNTEN